MLVHLMRDFNDRQSQLFLALSTFLAGYRPDDLNAVVDEDLADAAAALAATFETASRGVIYDHRPASLPAGRLSAGLRAAILEVGPTHGGTPFERDTSTVLRKIEGTVRDLGSLSREGGSGNRPFLDLLERVTRGRLLPQTTSPGQDDLAAPRLIVP